MNKERISAAREALELMKPGADLGVIEADVAKAIGWEAKGLSWYGPGGVISGAPRILHCTTAAMGEVVRLLPGQPYGAGIDARGSYGLAAGYVGRCRAGPAAALMVAVLLALESKP